MTRTIHIPNDLTVEQALSLLEFLDILIDSIYCVYADEIKDVYRQGMTVIQSLRESGFVDEDIDF